jgi:hypothetical protein
MGRWLGSLALAGVMALGCGDDVQTPPPTGGGAGGATTSSTSSTGGGGQGGAGGAVAGGGSKIDVLLVVDNSRGIAEKQFALQASVPHLLSGLRGLSDDIHFGVVSSSLGGHGADSCTAQIEASEDDQAHLLDASGTVATYDGLGFLAWDPQAALSPPGESDASSLSSRLAQMIGGAGEVGCGYEATLEAWYRFLVDPNPHTAIAIDGSNNAVLGGTDDVLLKQRADFLRPDSLLVVVVLSDENDCSTRDGGQSYLAGQIYSPGSSTPYHLPKPRAACATDPNDPCCRSCQQAPGAGCSTASDDCSSGPLSTVDDNINVRCFEQKRRFGMDFLYPLDRYVTGLTAAQVSDRNGNVVANPVFTDLSGMGSPVRSAADVLFVAIVGVPWQDVTRLDAGGAPDPMLGVMSGAELAANGRFPMIVGDPDSYVPPTDPLMQESFTARAGTNPVTGDAVAAPGAAYDANPINGHEYTNAFQDDLQYACVYPLPQALDCTDPNNVGCDCLDPSNDNPLCQNANTDQFGQTQYRDKARPGLRHLAVVQALGDSGMAGSACPVQMNDVNAPDYAYLPVITTLVEQAAAKLP